MYFNVLDIQNLYISIKITNHIGFYGCSSYKRK